jgi:hypothetical protein
MEFGVFSNTWTTHKIHAYVFRNKLIKLSEILFHIYKLNYGFAQDDQIAICFLENVSYVQMLS